jgi:hypothetical protein
LKKEEKKKGVVLGLKAQNAAYFIAKGELIRVKIHFYVHNNVFVQREKEKRKKKIFHLHAREEQYYTGRYLRHTK